MLLLNELYSETYEDFSLKISSSLMIGQVVYFKVAFLN